MCAGPGDCKQLIEPNEKALARAPVGSQTVFTGDKVGREVRFLPSVATGVRIGAIDVDRKEQIS
jgi:hypothetical protein